MPDLSGFPRVIAALARGALRSIIGAIRRGLAGIPLVNWIRGKFAPLTATEAGVLRGISVEAISAGVQQTAVAPYGVVNPADVPQLPPEAAPTVQPGTIEYDVRVPLSDPATGRIHWTTVYVQSGDWLTYEQIAAEAIAASETAASESDPRGRWTPPIGYGPGGVQVISVVYY